MAIYKCYKCGEQLPGNYYSPECSACIRNGLFLDKIENSRSSSSRTPIVSSDDGPMDRASVGGGSIIFLIFIGIVLFLMIGPWWFASLALFLVFWTWLLTKI